MGKSFNSEKVVWVGQLPKGHLPKGTNMTKVTLTVRVVENENEIKGWDFDAGCMTPSGRHLLNSRLPAPS